MSSSLPPSAAPDGASPGAAPHSGELRLETFSSVRTTTEALCSSLEVEDYGLQSMENCSPPKWHLAHTTWFFETFLLKTDPAYRVFHPQFEVLFNSYYEAVGRMYPRPRRGLLSRPTVREVGEYRRHVDTAVTRRIARDDLSPAELAIFELGLHHEQQHQELILTDLKHGFAQNPLEPTLLPTPSTDEGVPPAPASAWVEHPGGLVDVGHPGGAFAFDNEGPRHRVYLRPFALASRPVTCAEFQEFISAGGYRRPELWLSSGWHCARSRAWDAPLYWTQRDDHWWHYTLGGSRPVDPHAPVCHVSFYEADAYARWAGARLPTEFEWEVVGRDQPTVGNFSESRRFHPARAHTPASPSPDTDPRPVQMFGDVWEWTASPYAAYPGYRAPQGALGEYNGKFMCNQIVLRGGSCATPRSHIRPTYRNFFYPEDRWQFSGLRLARHP